MPNWVLNEAHITGNALALNRFVEHIKSDEEDFDFDKIIPMPNDLFMDNLSFEDRITHPYNWYDWSIANWGTKWKATDTCVTRNSSDEVSVSFMTAWSFPTPIWVRLTKDFPELTFRVDYADEDIGFNCGTFCAYDDKWSIEEPDDTVEFGCNLWGIDYKREVWE